MKTKLLFTLLVLNAVFAGAQNYKKLLGVNNDWYIGDNYYSVKPPTKGNNATQGNLNAQSGHYYTTADTTFNSVVYKQVHHNFFNNLSYTGALREDTLTKQVFFVPMDSTSEILLYDFSLGVGDSVYLYEYHSVQSSYESGWYKVDSTTTGTEKTMYLCNRLNYINPATGKKYVLVWVEGAGSKNHVFYPYLQNATTYGPFSFTCNVYNETVLTCKYTDGVKIYFDTCVYNNVNMIGASHIDSCSYTLPGAVEEINKRNGICVFPNPVVNEFNIKFENPYTEVEEVALLDLVSGKRICAGLVKQGFNKGESLALSSKDFPSGFYIVQCKTSRAVLFSPLVIVH